MALSHDILNSLDWKYDGPRAWFRRWYPASKLSATVVHSEVAAACRIGWDRAIGGQNPLPAASSPASLLSPRKRKSISFALSEVLSFRCRTYTSARAWFCCVLLPAFACLPRAACWSTLIVIVTRERSWVLQQVSSLSLCLFQPLGPVRYPFRSPHHSGNSSGNVIPLYLCSSARKRFDALRYSRRRILPCSLPIAAARQPIDRSIVARFRTEDELLFL